MGALHLNAAKEFSISIYKIEIESVSFGNETIASI